MDTITYSFTNIYAGLAGNKAARFYTKTVLAFGY